MNRALIVSIAVLAFGTAHGAQTGRISKVFKDRWQATDRSMGALLAQGYRLVSVVAPSAQLRVFFLSKGASVAKCSEEQVLKNPLPTPRPDEKGEPKFDPRGFVPEMETKIECSRLVKGRG